MTTRKRIADVLLAIKPGHARFASSMSREIWGETLDLLTFRQRVNSTINSRDDLKRRFSIRQNGNGTLMVYRLRRQIPRKSNGRPTDKQVIQAL